MGAWWEAGRGKRTDDSLHTRLVWRSRRYGGVHDVIGPTALRMRLCSLKSCQVSHGRSTLHIVRRNSGSRFI